MLSGSIQFHSRFQFKSNHAFHNTLFISIPNHAFQFQFVTISNQFNSQSCLSIPICHNLKSIQFGSALNKFNLCFRYTGYQNHRHGSAELQAGIKKRFYNIVRSRWAADWLLKNKSISEHYRYGPTGLLIGVTHQYNRSQYCYFDPYWYTNFSFIRTKRLTFD